MTTQLSQPAYTDQRAIIGGRCIVFTDPKSKFDALAEAWDDDNLGMSTSNYQHPAHLQIIGMGTAAIPMLLDKLRQGQRRWVYALKFITGEQPDTPEMKANAELARFSG
ncbi:MAG TPA: hypothetical protein VFE47_26360 [Tepidisphaeraceae bacterium]|jgi:hypothetical protein|nr:hypothetical protein [Tepidisphaeraceae bacterium]